MKNIRWILLLAMVVLVSGCRDYLDVKPQGKVIPKTESEFAAVLNYRLNNIESGQDKIVGGCATSILTDESFSDNLDATIMVGKLAVYAGTDINNKQHDYRDIYGVIKDCNIIIDNVEGNNSELSKQLSASCYTLKGMCYYNLMRNFCEPYEPGNAADKLGLSIMDGFDVEYRPLRSDLQTTGEYVVSLFKKAIAYNISDPKYLLTADISKAFLAKTYFWMQQWDEVIPLCKELLAADRYPLEEMAMYKDIIQAKNEKKSGVVFRTYVNSNSSYSNSDYVLAVSDLKTRPVSKAFVDLFSADKSKDVRYEISFNGKRVNEKNPCSRIRAAELCLMLAESYYHSNQKDLALEQLNLLRSKRITDVVDYTMGTLPAVDVKSLIKVNAKGEPLTPLMGAIFAERRKELYMESDRWFELKRNGRPEWWVFSNGYKYTIHKYLYTFPIYKVDVDLLDGMIQNEGYIN